MHRRKLLARAALAAALAAGLSLVAEAGYRGWCWAAGETYSSARAAERMSELDRSMDVARRNPELNQIGPRVPSPYFAWEELAIQEGLLQQIEYFRSPEAERAYDVLIVGGAGALRFAEQGFEVLAKVLATQHRLADRPIRSAVLAREGGKQPQQLNVVAYALMLGWRPDAVLNLDGATELLEGLANAELGAHPYQPAASVWGPLDLSTGSDRETMDHLLVARERQNQARAVLVGARKLKLYKSAILGRAVLGHLERSAASVAEALAVYDSEVATKPRVGVTGPSFSPSRTQQLQLIADTWRHGSISLNAICATRGIAYVHVLEPASEKQGSAIRRGYPLLLERGAELRERGLRFVDGSRLVLPRKLARAIALALVEGP